MAFGYEYLMVYLPEVCSTSYLLFVHNPEGSTKLRDYSSGSERQLSVRLSVQDVLSKTSVGVTRFYFDPHRTNGGGVAHWVQITRDLNRRLEAAIPRPPAVDVPRSSALPRSVRNRAVRGSRRQLQDYVNQRPDALSQAVMRALPPRLRELGASIRWVSPLADQDYAEYRDAEFLRAVALSSASGQLAEFWPAMGPCWDALGIVADPAGRLKPGVVLVEAKSHIPEIYGRGCQAVGETRDQIDRALAETKAWLAVPPDSDWMGPLYQYANRLAHLYFLLKKACAPAWLVNLYFEDDPIGPTSIEEWRREIGAIKTALGIAAPAPNAVDVFLPAIAVSDREEGPSIVERAAPENTAAAACSRAPEHQPPSDPANRFRPWCEAWMRLARFQGPCLTNPEERIGQLIELWNEPVPGVWQRRAADTPARLLDGRRYTRGNDGSDLKGEDRIEHEILCGHFDSITCCGDSRLVDGVNAFPLARDAGGGRSGNVEADLLLLTAGADGHSVLVGEVKVDADNAWYALVENLRQLKLLLSYDDRARFFRERNPCLDLPAQLPISGAVVAPFDFYRSPGQKANSVPPARRLLEAFQTRAGEKVRLLVWDLASRRLTELP